MEELINEKIKDFVERVCDADLGFVYGDNGKFIPVKDWLKTAILEIVKQSKEKGIDKQTKERLKKVKSYLKLETDNDAIRHCVNGEYLKTITSEQIDEEIHKKNLSNT